MCKGLAALLLATVLLTGCGAGGASRDTLAPGPAEPAATLPQTATPTSLDDSALPAASEDEEAAALLPSTGWGQASDQISSAEQSVESPQQPAGETPEPARETAPGNTLPGCLANAPAVPADARRVLVKRAVDGDTLELADGTRVRLTGINTPESVDPRRPVERMGKEAAAYTASLVEGQEVYLQPSRRPVDRYGRTLAWVWLADGTFLNAKLVYDGYAQVATYPDNPDYASLFLQCEREAREAERGLWAPISDGEVAVTEPEGHEEAVPDGVTILAEPGSVSRGSTASITVQTSPGARCEIVVRYKSGPSKAKGLEPNTAGSDGRITWSWTVGRNTTPGNWPVIVTCGQESAQTTVNVQ